MSPDIDATKTIETWIRRHEPEKIQAVGTRLKEALNQRNRNVFWRALIDNAGEMSAKRAAGSFNGDPLACVKAMVAGGLALNFRLEKGEYPIHLALERDPQVGLGFLKLGPDLNALNDREDTALLSLIKLMRVTAPSVDRVACLAALAAAPGIKWELRDQGASAFFDALPLLAIMADNLPLEPLKEASREVVKAFAGNGFDINAPRGKATPGDEVKINTPLAFFIKRMAQWNRVNGGRLTHEMSEMVSHLTQALLDHGADPCLQMEAGARLALMDVCRNAGFEPGLAARLESAAIGAAAPMKKAETSRRGGSRL